MCVKGSDSTTPGPPKNTTQPQQQHTPQNQINQRLIPRERVVSAYGVRGDGGAVTDLVSFYTLPSSVLGHPEHSELLAAYMYYTVPGSVSAAQLLGDALVLAAAAGYDVFNALDLLEVRSLRV